MKIKKSKFAKLLTLALPIAAISIVTPVVLTSCGSSNSTTTPDKPDNGGTGDGGTSGGGTSGGGSTTTQVVASWKTDFADNITKDSDGNPIITLGKDDFSGTSISKNSKFADIVTSLTPPTISSVTKQEKVTTKEGDNSESTPAKTLYSLLSSSINELDKYSVKLNINPNTISFDYTNDDIGNSVKGQFVLTPIDSKVANQVSLSFTINNFDDSYNGESGKQLTWKVDEIQKAFSKQNVSSTGNNLPEETPTAGENGKGTAAVINLKGQSSLGVVMDELCGTTISGPELKSFISNGDTNAYNLDKASISTWAPNVDNTMVFTRVVVPNTDETKENAVLYIVYTGFKEPEKNKIDAGNAAWNRNLPYFTDDVSKDLWDLTYKEPVIDLSKIDGITLEDGTKITKDSTVDVIKTNADKIRDYMAKNYILGFNGNFTISNSNQTKEEGKFDANGEFQKNASVALKSILKENSNEKADEKDPNDGILKNNNNVFKIHFVIQPTENRIITSSSKNDNIGGGIYKGFYLTGYKTTEKQN